MQSRSDMRVVGKSARITRDSTLRITFEALEEPSRRHASRTPGFRKIRSSGADTTLLIQYLPHQLWHSQMYCVALQALIGEYRESVLALMSMLNRLCEDTSDYQLQFVFGLQDVIAWIVQVDDGSVVQGQTPTLLNMTGFWMSEIDVATNEIAPRRGHHCECLCERRWLTDEGSVIVMRFQRVSPQRPFVGSLWLKRRAPNHTIISEEETGLRNLTYI